MRHNLMTVCQRRKPRAVANCVREAAFKSRRLFRLRVVSWAELIRRSGYSGRRLQGARVASPAGRLRRMERKRMRTPALIATAFLTLKDSRHAVLAAAQAGNPHLFKG